MSRQRLAVAFITIVCGVLLSACSGSQTCGSPDAGLVCVAGGTGNISVTVTGLPAGVDAKITLTGASIQQVTRTQTLSGVGSGAWGVDAEKVTVPDSRVRTVYAPTANPSSFCLAAGGTQNVVVTYAPVATSNKLWTLNENGGAGQFLGFGSSKLTATGSPNSDVAATHAFGGDIAFDLDGNVWVLGATAADANLLRFPAGSFASSGDKTADREINLSGGSCVPLLSGIAFDPAGNLYLSSACLHEVIRFDASQLTASGTLTPTQTLSNIVAPTGLAFDKMGNLWVADQDSQQVWRYDASQLSASGTVTAPAYKLGARATDTVGDNSLLAPSWLAFDATGNLYANNFGGNVVYRLGISDLSGTGSNTVTPQVRVTVGVTALLSGMAFDESGGLWNVGAQHQLTRLAPEQLDVSSNAGAPTIPSIVLTSADIGDAANVAFYPAPASLPLYDHVP